MKDVEALGLEPISWLVAHRLVTEFPEWANYFSATEDRRLRIAVPTEHAVITAPLVVEVDADGVVSVTWHSNRGEPAWSYDWIVESLVWPEPSDWGHDSTALDGMADWLSDFVAEDLVAVTLFARRKWIGAAPAPIDGITPRLGIHADEAILRSWRGTYDRALRKSKDGLWT